MMTSYWISACIGVMVAAVSGWGIYHCFMHRGTHFPSSVQGLWRPLWPFISVVAVWTEPFLSWSQRHYLAKKAYQAALPSCVKPAHMLACWLWVTLLGVALGIAVWQGLEINSSVLWGGLLGGVAAGAWSLSVCAAKVRRYQRAIDRDLPFFLDMMTLCVESGLSLQRALHHVDRYIPSGVLIEEIRQLLSDLRSGYSTAQAFKALAVRCDSASINAWVSVMVQSDQLGMSVGVILRETANQYRVERIQRAEKLAIEAPVKMLLPLIGCIFPCTFIVLAFPIVVHIWRGMP